MGTSAALGAAVGAAVAAGALAECVAGADAAALDEVLAADDDVPGLQAESASPTPRPSAEMVTILVVRVKCPKFIFAPLIVPVDQA
jgi:hypothetical protein